MRPDEWDRLPGPWRAIHAVSSVLIVALAAAGALLALR